MCDSIICITDEEYNANVENGYTYENETCIAISSNDTSLIYKKKYINGEWVDALPSESNLIQTNRLVHKYGADDRFLSEAVGELATLETTDKTSLVDAVNECFQSASDGKTAIANSITGADSSLTIPDNPTFAQLAALIGQLGGLQIATGSVQEITTPSTITGETSFTPKLVVVYNYGTGTSNVNIGVYVNSELIGTQLSDSVYGLGGTLSRYSNPFTITSTGFSFVNKGAATNLKWIALG